MSELSPPIRFLSIELEPTHYKTDLWNTVSESENFDVYVLYTQAKNWLPDGGHNYLKFPDNRYQFEVMPGKGSLGALHGGWRAIKNIISRKPDMVGVSGYVHLPAIMALLFCFIFRIRFLVYVDQFNNDRPPGKLSAVKYFVRETLRKFCFRFATGILVCGKQGIASAKAAGCNETRVFNFPYTINKQRILSDKPETIPDICLNDLQSKNTVIFFSGRMIERKGLASLLTALKSDSVPSDWVLWIEGDGLEIERFKTMASELNLQQQCRFLGFCQYDLHSWLLRESDIVVVPSLEDNWGIVVDEGLQLGKAVITSDATGSALDRIDNEVNGFVVNAGNIEQLAKRLSDLLLNKEKIIDIGKVAAEYKTNVTPQDNLATLLHLAK